MDYTIKQGDNLTRIAQANNTDVATLAKLNNIQNPNLIQTGATLKLPTAQNTLTATNPATSTVPAPNLNNVNQVQLPPTPVPTTPTIPLSMADKAVQDSQKALESTPTQNLQTDLISQKMNAILGMNALGTEAQAKQDELVKQGYQQKLQEYNALNSQILQKQAEMTQINNNAFIGQLEAEKRDTLLPFAQMGQAKIEADKQILLARKGSEIALLNAQVSAKQGDIQLAQQMAQDAVDLKFAPFKARIQMHDDLLKAIDPILTRDEKKQANEQQLRGQIALKEIDRVSDFQKTTLNNAFLSGAPDSILQAIGKTNSINEILSIPGVSKYLASPIDKANLAKIRADIGKITAESLLNSSAGLTQKQRQEIVKNPTAKQAAARIGVMTAIQDYTDKYNKMREQSRSKVLTRAQVAELKAALDTTVGSAINVAQGQGAMNNDEAVRIIGTLKPSGGIMRTSSQINSAARGAIDAQKSLYRTDLGLLESTYPGISSDFQLFADFDKTQMTDEDFFNSNGQNSLQLDNQSYYGNSTTN